MDCRKNPNLYSITLSDGQHVENVLSHIKPTTESYRKFLEWKQYQKEQENELCDDPYGDIAAYNDEWSQEDIDSGLADAYESDLDPR